MQLMFTKTTGKTDQLAIHRNGRAVEHLDCPKQRIIPHEMVHYAVESIVAERGFLGRVAAGETASFRMTPEAVSDGVERLVEVIQGDAWSGGETAPDDMIALYAVTCEARECPALPVDAATITAIRDHMASLTDQWAAVPIGGTLTLTLD